MDPKALSKLLCMPLFWSIGATMICPANGHANPNLLVVNDQKDVLKGSVYDADGPLSGAVIRVKGTNNAALSDLKGEYQLKGLKKGAVIEVSLIGYIHKTFVYNGEARLDILLEEDTQNLNEVVVTALGIKREKKALGYSMQEIKGTELVSSRETNLANALSGKISGLQVIRSGNGPGASSKIQLRGSNSLTGLNQPLIVVDGIPLENFTGATNNDLWNPTADMGNGIADINPEDIASMSVLKGASAAALYGSRAGNGVILITTKQGRKTEGLGVTYSQSVSAETIFMTPKMQNVFGQGGEGVYDKESGSSWGPRIEGQEYEKWNGEKAFMRSYDNVENFFQTGLNFTETVSFAQQFNKTAVYSSFTRMDDKSKIPGSDLNRTSFTARVTSPLGDDDRWMLDTKVQYINSEANNRPISGRNSGNSFMSMYLMPRSLDIRDFSAGVRGDNTMLWYGSGQGINPYWAKDHKLNNDVRDRFLLSASLKYHFTSWLNAELKAGSDMYFTEYDSKTYAGGPLNNAYFTKQDRFYENNLSFLLSAHKDNIYGKWGANATFGGNLMSRNSRSLSASVGKLKVPDLFTVNNGEKAPNIEEKFSRMKINSFYGTAQVNYDGFFFLDGTFRNDWSSTLSKENRSYFYPSISTSWVISDMLQKMDASLPEWFSYSKLRASFAEVGNSLEPFQLYNTYSIGQAPDETPTISQNKVKYNKDVRSELIKSWEVGAELRFFNNRLGLDVAWYKTNATRQLINLPMDDLSGYNARKINAGNIENQGWEIMLNARPIQTASGFKWDVMMNFSSNRNRIVELYKTAEEEITLYPLGGYDNVQVYAKAGGNYGEIWGTTFKRVTDEKSPYYGKLITENGLPTATTEKSKIGDQQAKGLLGITNTFSYKGWTFGFMIDARFGGEIFSGTHQMMQLTGTSDMTVVNGERPKMVVDGVFLNSSGNYEPNTTEITTESYWKAVAGAGNLGVGELNIYDATNIRLRNISLSYDFSKEQLRKLPFRQLKLGVSCNNVWMLKSHMKGIDPESIYATSTNATGFELGSAPTSRTYLFNLTVGF
ncbi:SusC/RagA family TonB-linked outer membrane protein [Alloprevotella sp. OH1205_COT-284]|uniref:SusC/RagA family TonB-linked outer membrane protein n=1 Tax=Alloprevotella sp. OH1205_COT-284 TaxID=2491043 RepID=UPI001F305EB7|nr:SusC/RagA family TonB-linked outer membrane protein [Alloprevotella sp. OH1205_COT-284]